MIGAALFLFAAASTGSSAPREPVIFAQIAEAVEHGRLVQAREMLGMAAHSKQDAKSPAFQRVSGQISLAEGDEQAALDQFQKVLKARPDDCIAAEGAGIAAIRLGQDDLARTALGLALKHCRDRWQTFNAIGALADRGSAWSESEAAYRSALALKANQPLVLNNLGYSLILQRRFAEAEAVLRRAQALLPRDARIANNLDLAVAGQGKPVTTQASDEAYRLNNAGYMAYLDGRYDEARAYFNAALKLSGAHFERAAANLEMLDAATKP